MSDVLKLRGITLFCKILGAHWNESVKRMQFCCLFSCTRYVTYKKLLFWKKMLRSENECGSLYVSEEW